MLHEFNPKKSLGQNFLVNPHILDKIVATAEVSKDDIILEVGPGTGNLTKKLAEKAKKVIAIEKDHRLIEPLKETFKNYPNVEIIEGDILDINTKMPFVLQLQRASLYYHGYKIVANIPYYITSIFLHTIFESAGWQMVQPKLIVLTIQKEVAQRIVAKPPHMNLLALSVQYYSKPEIIGYISKNNFRPIPKVDSAIIRLKPRLTEVKPLLKDSRKLFELLRIGFSEKRKQLASVLSKKLKTSRDKIIETFQRIGIKETVRAENLSLEEWKNLQNLIDNNLDSDRITNKVTGS